MEKKKFTLEITQERYTILTAALNALGELIGKDIAVTIKLAEMKNDAIGLVEEISDKGHECSFCTDPDCKKKQGVKKESTPIEKKTITLPDGRIAQGIVLDANSKQGDAFKAFLKEIGIDPDSMPVNGIMGSLMQPKVVEGEHLLRVQPQEPKPEEPQKKVIKKKKKK